MNPYLGEIRIFAFNFAPQGWAMCNGQLLAISSNTPLFSLLGTTYGGNGTSTFALPNLQSRVAIHQGQGQGLSPYIIGQQGGTETVTLTLLEMPHHNHIANVVSGPPATAPRPSNAFPGNDTSGATYSTANPDSTFNNNFVAYAGSSQPHNNIQPYLCVTFCMAVHGTFPPRN